MYAVRAVPAPLEVRTHEYGYVPSCLQPLQVALLREAFARAPHPPRTGSPTEKVTFRLVISNFSRGDSLLFEGRLVTFRQRDFG